MNGHRLGLWLALHAFRFVVAGSGWVANAVEEELGVGAVDEARACVVVHVVLCYSVISVDVAIVHDFLNRVEERHKLLYDVEHVALQRANLVGAEFSVAVAVAIRYCAIGCALSRDAAVFIGLVQSLTSRDTNRKR